MAEAKLLSSLWIVFPEDLRSLVLHSQMMSLAEVLFVAMTFVEPGGMSDRMKSRENVSNPRPLQSLAKRWRS